MYRAAAYERLSQRPDFDHAMGDGAGHARDHGDRRVEIRRLDDREAGQRHRRGHEGAGGDLDTGRLGVADLHRRPRDTDHRTLRNEASVRGLGGIADGGGRAVIAGALAIPDGDELRHLGLLFSYWSGIFGPTSRARLASDCCQPR
jgi:hypothetical protein